MKAIILFSFLFGNMAMACPDLTGIYNCAIVTQEIADDVTNYTITDNVSTYVFQADGKTHQEVQKRDGLTVVIESVGICSEETFFLDLLLMVNDDMGNELNRKAFKIDFSLDANKNLLIHKIDGDGESQTQVCKRDESPGSPRDTPICSQRLFN